MAVTFNGLISGLDTSSIIDALVSLEKGQVASLKTRRDAATTRKSKLEDMAGRLRTLGTAGAKLGAAGDTRSASASSADETSARVSVIGTPRAAAYELSVTRLARAETTRSGAFTSDAAGVFTGPGTLTMNVAGGAPIDVSYGENDSLSALASRIEAASADVRATVVHDGSAFRLLVSSRHTGASNSIEFTDSTGQTGLADAGAEIVAAQDAAFTLDGLPMTRAQNSFTDVVAGLKLELRAAGGSTTVRVEAEVAKDTVKGFVDAFNGVSTLVSRELTYGGTTMGADRLFGDATVQRLQRELSGALAKSYGGFTPSSVGLKLTPTGGIDLDATKLAQVYADAPDRIESVLAGPGGLMAELAKIADRYGNAHGGMLKGKADGLKREIEDNKKRSERIEERAEKSRVALNRRFAALEGAMATMQQQMQHVVSLFR